MRQAQQTQHQSQQTQPICSTTEQELTLQQALGTHEQPQQAQPLSPQTTQLLPELIPDLSAESSPNTPLSSFTGMHDERQQTSHKASSTLSNTTPCPLLIGADCNTAPQVQPATEIASPLSAAHASAAAFTSTKNKMTDTVQIGADQAPSPSSNPNADVQSVSWAASSSQLMCCPLTQVSPPPAACIACTISSMLPVCRLLVSGKMHEEYASRGGSRSLQLSPLPGSIP